MNLKIRLLKLMTGILVVIFSLNQVSGQSGWELVYDETGFGSIIKEICFVPGDDGQWQTGWAVQYQGTILKTTDGGDTWASYSQNFSENLWGISFVDENIGYICNLDGQVLKSVDGGETWQKIYENESNGLSKIEFKDANNGVATGNIFHIYTSDGGQTWTPATTGSDYWRLDYAEGDTYYAVAAVSGNVGQSTDNGAEWDDVYTFPAMAMCVDFLDINTGVIGAGGGYFVEYTHDAGETWTQSMVGEGNGDILAADWVDAGTVWACGSGIFKSTDSAATWVEDTTMTASDHSNREMFVTDKNVVYASADRMDDFNSQIWRKVDLKPLVPVFESSETYICAGSSIDFTDVSYYDVVAWEWTFEGGTPSSSTEQNPTVTYNNGGTFDVTLTVTNDNGETQTLNETDFIKVFEIPEQPALPSGEENLCGGNEYGYSVPEIAYAQAFEWEVIPSEAGEITWDNNNANFDASEIWSGDFSIRVQASNFCGDGPWSEMFTGTLSISPEIFVLQGGGSFCEGGEGVEITLSESQDGVDYELHLDGNPTGQIIPGNGSTLSYGNQTEAGIYEALGQNENCEAYMSEQVEVTIYALPTPEVSGLEMVCDEDVTDYETADNAGSTYTWEVTGGNIIDGQGTYMATIEWGVAGSGTVTVIEEYANGCSATTEAFDVFIDDCTDINETVINNFNVYPNPATNQLNVQFSYLGNENLRIVIFDLLGQIVIESGEAINEGANNVHFDFSNLKKGLYFLRVQSGTNTILIKKVIKK